MNTCQPTHIEPLLRVYTASCSVSDLQVLSIFQLFESQRGLSVATLVSRWSPTPGLSSSSVLEAINALNSNQVLRTCLAFPNWRRLQDGKDKNRNRNANKDVYDPVFILLLFALMLLESPPSSTSGWVELFRSNVVCLLIRCMSSRDDDLRDLALCQIVALWKSLQVHYSSSIASLWHYQHLFCLFADCGYARRTACHVYPQSAEECAAGAFDRTSDTTTHIHNYHPFARPPRHLLPIALPLPPHFTLPPPAPRTRLG